jgi:hypothetical protein
VTTPTADVRRITGSRAERRQAELVVTDPDQREGGGDEAHRGESLSPRSRGEPFVHPGFSDHEVA